MDELSKIKELIERLNYYRDMYYNHDRSIISDREYDSLFDQLTALEHKTGILYPNSPTQSVGYKSVSKLNKVTHNHKLLSLDKTTDINEFISFFGDKPFILMPKLDGLTCSIIYRNGELYSAESRGDGIIGEDITHNAMVFSNLPKTIPYKNELIIDGECIITDEDFDRINRGQVVKGEQEYKNRRNLASGTVRSYDSSVVADRNVQFIAWKLYKADGMNFTKHHNAIQFLQNFGISTVAPQLIHNGKEVYRGASCEELIEYMRDIYGKLGIPIDGMVGMFDDIEYGLSLGSTTHHPRHSLAFKFYPDSNETVLRDIEWSTSRTGLINPVAIFDPIEIDGTTVSRATLTNVSIIKELELGIGDTVTVIKANEIIPKITENLTRSNTYKIPNFCPSCGKPTVIKNDNGRETLRCENDNCPEKLHDKIANFASRDGMNIVGISEERLRTLIDMGYITSFESLYHLKDHRNELIGIPGFGESSVDNILQAIEESRKCKLANVIVAIGIPSIGKTAAKTIADKCEEDYQSCKEVYDNSFDYFLDSCVWRTGWHLLPGIGIKTQHIINDYVVLNISELFWLVKELDIVSNYKPEENPTVQSDELKDKTFCITGKLKAFNNRSALIDDIKSKGGKVVSSVTKNTQYLITNDPDSGSSKNIAARKYGTKIITETDYILGNL